MDYEELHEKYIKLLEENEKLRIENTNFKIRLGLALPIFDSQTPEVQVEQDLSNQFIGHEQVTNSSSPQEKNQSFYVLIQR